MKKRIYGLETEFGLALIGKDGVWNCEPTTLSYYLTLLPSHSFPAKQFSRNGARIYVDVSYHPEYCTAECLDLADLIAQDKAGEKILDKFFIQAVEREGAVKRLAIFKNNVQCVYSPEEELRAYNPFNPFCHFPQSSPATFGCHENFSTHIGISEITMESVFIPFLIARQVVSGSGWVANQTYQNRGFKYAISQRDRFINSITSNSTTGTWENRAILSTARWNEPLADNRKYNRLHLILGDSNMSEISTYLKMGTVGILLEMIEEGYPLAKRSRRLMPLSPVEAMHRVCFDITCKKPVIELSDGQLISALDMLWEYVEIVDGYKRLQGLNPELSDVFFRLKDGLQRLERREIDRGTMFEIDSQGLDEEWDWLIKKSILDCTLKSYGCHWNNFAEKQIDLEGRRVPLYDKLIANDLKYHDISSSGLYNEYTAEPDLPPSRLKELRIRTPRLVSKERIEFMEENPPQNTRAKARGDFIRFLLERGLSLQDFSIDWTIITSPSNYALTISLSDPFAAENDQVKALMAIIQQQSASS